MHTSIYWKEFAEAIVTRCVRAGPGDSFLIITTTASDIRLAEACLAAGIRAGADTQLMVISRIAYDAASTNKPGPIISNAILASNVILELCDWMGLNSALSEARGRGTRVLLTHPIGVEDYVIRALLDVDVDAMIRNAGLVAKLWDQTKHCHVTSPQGTDVSFDLMPRKSLVSDGALSRNGEQDYCPGAQVSIAPVEETINGRIVIDASDSVQGIVYAPYSFTMEKGVVTCIEGGEEADLMRGWLESRKDENIYRMCHFSIGLNPQAGISANTIEGERMLAGIDFGFGSQDPDFGGALGPCSHHEDVMLATPTIYLDGNKMSGDGKLNPDLGFEQLPKYLGGHHQ